VSNRFQTLRAEAVSLQRLADDVAGLASNGTDWQSMVVAPRTLDPDQPIESWYLAEYFLNAWVEWHTVLDRYLRYFGQPLDRIPRVWGRLKIQSKELAGRLQCDPSLDKWIARSCERLLQPDAQSDADVSALFHQVINSHSRLALVRNSGEQREGGPMWRSSSTAAWGYDRQVKQRLYALPFNLREPLLWHLRHYRHAMLDVSWLDEPRWNEGDEARRSAFEDVLGRPSAAPPWIGRFTDDLRSDMPSADQVYRVLCRIMRAIAEIGYECFFDDVTSNEMNPGPDSPLGDEAVRVIRKDMPGGDPALRNIVVGVARGSQKRAFYGRPNVLVKLGETLTAAAAPMAAIVLVDSWDTAEFQREHFPAFRLHHARGHRFLFLLVGSPETQVAPLPLDLGPERRPLATATDFAFRRSTQGARSEAAQG